MNGREKSDPVIVAVKSPNKTGEPAAEAMERRVGAEENARQRRTRRTQSRESVTPTPERVRTAARFCRHYPRPWPGTEAENNTQGPCVVTVSTNCRPLRQE